jgi:hypothetical protein
MNPRLRAIAAVMSAVMLSACGEYLGDQRFDGVRLVSARPQMGEGETDYGGYLEVSFSSDENLGPVIGRASLYVHGDFCPIRDRYKFAVFGPYASGKALKQGPGTSVEVLPRKASGQRVFWMTPGPPPDLKPGTHGRYHYTAYIVPAHPMPGVEYADLSADSRYNLVTAGRNVCLRIDSPGYNIVPSRSATIVVPASDIRAAFNRPTRLGGS